MPQRTRVAEVPRPPGNRQDQPQGQEHPGFEPPEALPHVAQTLIPDPIACALFFLPSPPSTGTRETSRQPPPDRGSGETRPFAVVRQIRRRRLEPAQQGRPFPHENATDRVLIRQDPTRC